MLHFLLFNTCTACSVWWCHSGSSEFLCQIQHWDWEWAPWWACCCQRRHTWNNVQRVCLYSRKNEKLLLYNWNGLCGSHWKNKKKRASKSLSVGSLRGWCLHIFYIQNNYVLVRGAYIFFSVQKNPWLILHKQQKRKLSKNNNNNKKKPWTKT